MTEVGSRGVLGESSQRITYSVLVLGAHTLFADFLHYSHSVYPHLPVIKHLRKAADFTNFHEQEIFKKARGLFPRRFIYHAGPANSGKTHKAVERLKQAKTGVYCCPLRLLACEIYLRMNQKEKVPCSLSTGSEREEAENAKHLACTTEMLSLDTVYDVAIIDEIQLLADVQRGSAWTRAVLGVAAKEIHVCGPATAIPLMKRLLALTEEEMEVRHAEVNPEPVEVEEHALGDYRKVLVGDCIICFSKRDLFSVARLLKQCGKTFALVYGDLPNKVKVGILVEGDIKPPPLNNRLLFFTRPLLVAGSRGGEIQQARGPSAPGHRRRGNGPKSEHPSRDLPLPAPLSRLR